MATLKAESSVELHEYAVAEDNIREHGVSMYDAIMRHKKICWWTFFFAMSAVGWHVPPLSCHFELYLRSF
jgi:hypothetical protein